MNPIDIVNTSLTRIAARDSVVHAWTYIDAQGALASARIPANETTGPLAGWTFGVKDIIEVAGMPTTWGSAIYRGNISVRDAACVALARAAGAIVIGKTVSTEFAHLAPSVTSNPWSPERTPGGSSSGSAAAVADGHVRFAFGTQTMGSVLRPAAFCGVVGFKPTFGTISVEGVRSVAVSCDTIGWFARSVDDCERIYAALLELPELPQANRTLRYGLFRPLAWPQVEPALRILVEEAARTLQAREITFGFDDLDAVFATIQAYEMRQSLAYERLYHIDALSPQLRPLMEATPVSREAYLEAKERVTQFDIDAAFGDADLLVMPSTLGEAPTRETTGNPIMNRPASLLGLPAITVPIGFGPAGLPLGIQIVGRRWQDASVFAGARALASLFAPLGTPPEA